MQYIPNRNNKITDFKIGDIVVYNYYDSNLEDPKDRPRDIGRIINININKKYIYINARSVSGGICVDSIDFFPQRIEKKIIIKI